MNQPKTCLSCGFLNIQERELTKSMRVMLGNHSNSAIMPAHAEKTRCFKNLWDYDLQYFGDTFEGVAEEISRDRNNCPGFFKYEAGFTPLQHIENQMERRKETLQWRIAILGFLGAILGSIVGTILIWIFDQITE